MFSIRLAAISLVVTLLAGPGFGQVPPVSQWRGVNDAGGEFNSSPKGLPGTYDKDYHFSGLETLKYFRAQGFNMVRVPFRWERVQRLKTPATKDVPPELEPKLEQAEVGRLLAYLDNAREAAMGVVLDMHNYGVYKHVAEDGKFVTAVVGKDAPVPTEAFAAFWKQLAVALKDKPALWGYDLCNEPQYKNAEDWKQLTRAAVAAIRSVDTTHSILVEGTGWSHGGGWEKRHGPPWIDDPAGKVIYEAHDYMDADNSGTYRKSYEDETKSGKNPAARAIERIAPFAQWCQTYHVSGFLGEFGVPRKAPGWLTVLGAYLQKAQDEHLGWCYWAAGEWWGEGYPLSVQPRKSKDTAAAGGPQEHRPQMEVLRKYLTPKDAAPASPPGAPAPKP
jgi:endoglucanase